MSNDKYMWTNRIRTLVRRIIMRYSVQYIYGEDIAYILECPRDLVEAELTLLWKEHEDSIEPVYCHLCGRVMATYESPACLVRGRAPVCPDCWPKEETFSKADLVSAWRSCRYTGGD